MIDPDRSDDVLAAFVHNGSVATCFMNSLLQAFSHDASRPVRRLTEYHDAQGPYIHSNRSRVARYFLTETDKQWLWFLDNDILFPPDALDRMLEAAETHDCRVLGAAYWNQYEQTGRYLSWLLFTNDSVRAIESLPPTQDPIEVTAVGMGCTLIHRDVLQDVHDMHEDKDPWSTFGADVLRWEDGRTDRMGEDVTFCVRARRAGYLTYGLPSLIVEHYKPHYMAHGERAIAPA